MKQWFRYLFKTYFQSLGAALFFASILGIIFWLNDITIFLLVVIGSTCIFITYVLLDVDAGKLDHIFAGEPND